MYYQKGFIYFVIIVIIGGCGLLNQSIISDKQKISTITAQITPTLSPKIEFEPISVIPTAQVTSTLSPKIKSEPISVTTCMTNHVNIVASFPISTSNGHEGILRASDWSPDSQAIAFAQGDKLLMAGYPAYQAQLVAKIANNNLIQTVWSPDGQYIAVYGYHLNLYGDSIWVVSPDGENLLDILANNTLLAEVNGKNINQWINAHTLSFHIHGGSGIQHLWEVNVQTKVITPLIDSYLAKNRVEGSAQGGSYYWSPQNNLLIIDHYFNGRLVLTNLLKDNWLTPDSTQQFFLGWSSDNKHFIYSQLENSNNPGYSGTYTSSINLWLWDIDTQQGQKLLPSVYQASLSPNGQQVAFLQQLNERASFAPDFENPPDYPEAWPPRLRLGLLDLSTKKTTFYDMAGYKANEGPSWWKGGKPVWSPNSQAVAYWNEKGEIWLLSVNGAEQQCLTDNTKIVTVSWSPDGEKLALQSKDQLTIVETPIKP